MVSMQGKEVLLNFLDAVVVLARFVGVWNARFKVGFGGNDL
jgi:hypothetical protein